MSFKGCMIPSNTISPSVHRSRRVGILQMSKYRLSATNVAPMQSRLRLPVRAHMCDMLLHSTSRKARAIACPRGGDQRCDRGDLSCKIRKTVVRRDTTQYRQPVGSGRRSRGRACGPCSRAGYRYARRAMTAFRPPKAKALERATSTATARASFGTTSSAHSGSGSS